MTLTVECTHSTVKPLHVHIQWLLPIECVLSMALAIESTHSMTNPLNVYIQWLSTFSTTYIWNGVCFSNVVKSNRVAGFR